MFSIKTGLVIHADYKFTVISQNDLVRGEFSFVNNELLDSGLDAYGRADIYDIVEFGISTEETHATMTGVIQPVHQYRFDTVIPQNSFEFDEENKRIIVHSIYTFTVSEFPKPNAGLLTLWEFGIKGLSRVYLSDPFQDLHGLKIREGDKVSVEIHFTHGYYTNNLTSTLGETTFGERIDYTTEVVKLREEGDAAIRNTAGYAIGNPLEIFPIKEDIRDMENDDITFPVSDIYQQSVTRCIEAERRIDRRVVGYCPVETKLYGFILKDKIRGVGVLARFLQPVTINKEKRYEVQGFIKWNRTYDDIDDGYTTIDYGTYQEQFDLGSEIDRFGIIRPPIIPEAVSEIKGLQGISFLVGPDKEPNPVIDNATIQDVIDTLDYVGIRGVLLSNRPRNRTPSTFDLYTPEQQANAAALEVLRNADVNYDFEPIIIVAGNYVDNIVGENSWRWDLYYPYIGKETKQAIYSVAGFEKAKVTLQDLRDLDNQLVVKRIKGPDVWDMTASDVLDESLLSSRGLFLLEIDFEDLDWNYTDPDPLEVVYESDFDGENYLDWIEGKTTISINRRFLDITNDVTSDPATNLTEFTVTFESTRHNQSYTRLHIGDDVYWMLPEAFDDNIEYIQENHGIRIVKTVVGNRTRYKFTRPFTNENTQYIDVFFVGAGEMPFGPSECGYVEFNHGTQGFRVYNKVGSETTSSLQPTDNPFLCFGARLFQPLPDYVYKYRTLTTAQAATFFADPSINKSLNTNLFTIGFQGTTYSVEYQNTIDWKSPNLEGPELYPAIGFDLTKIDDFVSDNTVLIIDPESVEWSKADLLAARTTMPQRIIADTLYFVYPFQILEGNQIIAKQIISPFYDQEINLAINVEAILTYTLESATISPNPLTIMVGETMNVGYSWLPEAATINSAEWSTLDPFIASVSATGYVTGLVRGTTTLRLVLNNAVIATSTINVIDADIVISCADAPDTTTCLTMTGEHFGLTINDAEIDADISADEIRTYFRDNDSYRIVNCHDFTEPASASVSETGFMDLEGEYDVYYNGTLVGKDIDGSQVFDQLDDFDGIQIIQDTE